MEQKSNTKISSKKTKEVLSKCNYSNYHKKNKTEENILGLNTKPKNKKNLKSLRMQKSNISLIPDNNNHKKIKKINSIRPLTSSSHSNIDIFKSKNTNNKKNYKNSFCKQLNIQSKKNQYINLEKKRNTFAYDDRDYIIKKNNSNTSLSQIPKIKNNKSVEYFKINILNNNKNISVKNNIKKDYLDLNKIIRNDKNIILNKLNSSKSSNNFTRQYNKHQNILGKRNKYYLNSYFYNLNDNSELKNSSINMSMGTTTNGLSFYDTNNNIHKFNSFNNSISSSLLDKKNNKQSSIFGKCYINIDLSLNNNNSKNKTSFLNKRLLKKTLNLDVSLQKELKISNNLYNSPIERNKKNSKNYIDLRNNYNLSKINKKYVFTSRDQIPNIKRPKTKKIEIIKSKNKTAKNRLIPYNASKIIPINDLKNTYSTNITNNNSLKKENKYSIVGAKLRKNTDSKKDIFHDNDSKIWTDYINFQKLKSISQTPKNKINDVDINNEQFKVNSVNLNRNYFTEKILNKTNRTEISDFNNLSENNQNMINRKRIFSQENLSQMKNDNYMDEFNSLDNIDLKISVMDIKKNNKNDLKRFLTNRKTHLSENNNTQESMINNETKSKKKRYIVPNLKDINIIDTVSNLDNNCFNLNINNLGNKANTKNYNGMKIIISNLDSNKKKLSISPDNKINIVQYNGNNKKFNNMNINIDEYNSKDIFNNNFITNKAGNKIINFTEYNKELLKNSKKLENKRNNNAKESYTLLKSISFCKKINNPVKLNPNKRDELKINKEFYIKSDIKRIIIPTNKFKKLNNTVETKQNNRITNNNISGNNQKYKNIININNNTSNVNVLNVKNSSINICFEKKEKYKNLSPEKNINYSTTVNNIHRNNRITLKNTEISKIEKNKNIKTTNKENIKISNDKSPTTYIRISANTTRYNHPNINRNDNKLYSNNKMGKYNIKNDTHPLTMNNSQIIIYKNKSINKDFQEKDKKINIYSIKNNIDEDININKVSLNSARNLNTQTNENTDKAKKIPVKKNINSKLKLPNFSTNSSINILNKKYSYAVYIKPTCISSRSKSKNKNYKSEKKAKKYFINKKNLSSLKKPYKISRSLNSEEMLNTPPHKNIFNSLFFLNAELNICKSDRVCYEDPIGNKKVFKKSRKRIDFYLLSKKNCKRTNKIREPFTKNYCYINKYYSYNLKQPKIDKCHFYKIFLKKKLDKEQAIKTKKEKISNNKISNISVEKMNKDEIILNENANKITLSNNINNEDEKINESSQNGLIMTFGEVNYTKKNSERINNLKNSDIKNNNLLSTFNNDIINDESDLDIYKKLNIIQQEQENKIEDNISENEDIKFNFSEDEESEISGNLVKPLYNSNQINNNELCLFYQETNGKEIDDIDKKVSKTFKKSKIDNKYNLENAEKGLKILKKIALRRGYRSDDDDFSSNNNINSDFDKTKHKIFLGTNKLNELFIRKESKSSYNKKNNSYNMKYRNKNKCSKSVNKDIVKGITKIENFFEKKYFNDNTKINTYEGKSNNHRDDDFSEDNSCNIVEYNEEQKPKIRTYVQTNKNNLYFSEINVGLGESSNDYDFSRNLISTEKLNSNDVQENNENFDKKLYVKNNIIIKGNKYTFDDKNEMNNINLSIKENLLNEFKEEFLQDKLNDKKIPYDKAINNKNLNLDEYLINNKDGKTLSKDSKGKFDENLKSINYLEIIRKYQSNNILKYELIYLLNILTEVNYSNTLNKIKDLILYKEDNNNLSSKILNNNEDLIRNEHIFKDIIFKIISIQTIFTYLYAKLCNDLNNNISSALIEQKNVKNNKERNLKFIINEECIIFLNKYKTISKEYNISDKNSEEYILLKRGTIGFVIFSFELINLELLKQQFGFYILEQFYRKYIENGTNNIYNDLFLEACIVLLNKLGKIIFEKNNQKYIQNLNNFINNNLLTLIKEDDNNKNIPSPLKYKIINIVKKSENSWKESLFEIYQKERQLFLSENEIKEKEPRTLENKNEEKFEEKMEIKSTIIEDDLKNYISFFSEQDKNCQINSQKDVDKSYNWKSIDDLVNEEKYGLSYIIYQFINICSNIIHDENHLLLANDYIKNIIEYYSNILPKNSLEIIHNEMIKIFLNIDKFIKNNYYMSKILGNLLFILIENKLYHIKDFNNYLKVEKQTHINLAIITKYCIISSGKFAKRYFNDFKQTKLFLNNNIFKQYVSDALKDLFYFIK